MALIAITVPWMSFSEAFSVVVSIAALGISLFALRYAQRSAGAAERQAIAAERALPPPPPPVDWTLSHVAGDRYSLRNTGTQAATGLEIDTGRTRCKIRFEADGGETIESGGSSVVLVLPTINNPAPQEIWVTWDGQPEPVALPLPRQ